ncbi:MAG: FHA domain-containing protein [Acidimicrobiales bacterium]
MTGAGGGGPATRFVIEVLVPGEPAARVELVGDAVLGRSSDADAVVADQEVSRRHVRLVGTGGVVVAEDLGSTNGTRLGAVPLAGRQRLEVGAELSMGRSRVRLLEVGPPRSPGPAEVPSVSSVPPAGSPPPSPIATPPPPVPPAAAPAPPRADGGSAPGPSPTGPVLTLTPGVAQLVDPAVLAAELERAVDGLHAIGLADALPDGLEVRAVPAAITVGVAAGADGASITWWIPADLPPDPLLAGLAVAAAAARPAGEVLDVLALGLALDHLAVPDPAPGVARLDLPPAVPDARGPLRTAVARSFVGYLLARCGPAAVQAFLRSDPPPRFAERAVAHLGAELPALDAEWRGILKTIPPVGSLRGPLLARAHRPTPAGEDGGLVDRLLAVSGAPDDPGVVGSLVAASRAAHLAAGTYADEGDWVGVIVAGEGDLVATAGPFAGTIVAEVGVGDGYGFAAVAGGPRHLRVRATTDLDLVIVDGSSLRAAGVDLAGGPTRATGTGRSDPAVVDLLLVDP